MRGNLPEGQPYCLRSDIVFDSDIAYAVIFALRTSCGFTLTSSEIRNITLTKSKYNLETNITCEANITALAL